MQQIEEIIRKLTERQRSAVLSPEGRFIVKAGAGTGKTRVLVAKYLNIYFNKIKEGHSPEDICDSILAVTFTNKAAKEMNERLSENIPPEVIRNAHIQTIDSFCSRFLRENAFSVGLDPDFRVLDDVESKLVFRKAGLEVIEDEACIPIDLEISRDSFMNESFMLINFLKQHLISPDDFYSKRKDNTKIHQVIYELYRRYEEYLNSENQLDFGKLLFTTYHILKNNDIIRKTVQDRLKYVLVDEYQDTNTAQVRLLELISETHGNIFIVGDEKQSIYAFRGAEPAHIMESYENIPESMKVFLEDNFRFPEPLPSLVNSVFSDSMDNYLPIKSSVPGRAGIELFLGEDRKDEAGFVAERVRSFLDSGFNPREIVLLFRGVKNVTEYEEALKDMGVSIVTVGGTGFYEQDEIKDILAMLHVVDNPHMEKELVRMLRSPAFRVRNSELAALAAQKQKNGTLFSAVCSSDDPKIVKAREFIERFRAARGGLSLTGLINGLLEKSGLLYRAVSNTGGTSSRQMANLNRFLQLARKFETRNVFTTLSDFSDYLRQLEEIEVTEPEARAGVKGVVTLMSVHQSKGLEFPVVFICNVSADNFPGKQKMGRFHFSDEHGLVVREDDKNSAYMRFFKDRLYHRHYQEEKRLLYVAMTRAKKHLVITGFKNFRGMISKHMEYFLMKKENGCVLKPGIKEYVTIAGRDVIKAFGKEEKQQDMACLTGKKKEFEKAAAELGLPVFFRKREIPNEFSVTEVLAYAGCPMFYNFRYRLNIPEPPPHKEFSARLLGTAVHKILEMYYTVGKLNSTEQMKKEIARFIISSGVNGGDYSNCYRKHVEEIAGNLFDSVVLKPAVNVLFTEKPFVLKIKDSYIKGTVDRVDKLDNGAELIDYKISMTDDVSRYGLQVEIYKMAVEEIFKLNVKKCSIYFLRQNKIKEAPLIPFIQLRLESLLNGIKNGIFYRNQNSSCRYCPFRFICLK